VRCGLGGQDWDGPHSCGQALIRSHRPRKRVGWGRQVIIRTASSERVSRLIGSDPTQDLKPLSVAYRPGGGSTTGWRDGTRPSWANSSTGVPPPDRCVPHQSHHPSQPLLQGPCDHTEPERFRPSCRRASVHRAGCSQCKRISVPSNHLARDALCVDVRSLCTVASRRRLADPG
jgi:hypothetical protein